MLSQALQDDAPGMLGTEDMEFVNGWQPGKFVAQIPAKAEHIS